jgi:cytidylate kinase
MSVFEGNQTVTNDVQDANGNSETQADYVKQLAEARGEKWSDPQVIAKGKLEADEHITNLEKQLAEMRDDLAKNKYAEQVMEALKNKDGALTREPSEPNNNNRDGSDQNTTDKTVDIDSLVEQKLSERELKATLAQNVSTVSAHLEQQFGTEATKVVQDKAKELGMSMDKLKDMAGESPKAFLALVGSAPIVERNADVSSSVNTSSGSFNTSGQKNFQYWQNIRRENPNQYYRPNVQNEMVKSRQELGDKFYN